MASSTEISWNELLKYEAVIEAAREYRRHTKDVGVLNKIPRVVEAAKELDERIKDFDERGSGE